jgi:hypothetical protein
VSSDIITVKEWGISAGGVPRNLNAWSRQIA